MASSRPPGPQDTRRLGEVAIGSVGQEMGEHRRRERDVEARVLVGEADIAGGEGPAGVVGRVAHVHVGEAEGRMTARVAAGAPGDRLRRRVEALVGALRAERPDQRPRHPPEPATDVEHAVAGPQPGRLDEQLGHRLAGRGEVAVAHEPPQPPRRHEPVTPPEHEVERVERAQAQRLGRPHRRLLIGSAGTASSTGMTARARSAPALAQHRGQQRQRAPRRRTGARAAAARAARATPTPPAGRPRAAPSAAGTPARRAAACCARPRPRHGRRARRADPPPAWRATAGS